MSFTFESVLIMYNVSCRVCEICTLHCVQKNWNYFSVRECKGANVILCKIAAATKTFSDIIIMSKNNKPLNKQLE